MVYPLLTEYIEAIKSSQDNLDALKHLRPVLDSDGNPVMTGGNFAEVFKMKDEETGKHYALKCFLRDQERRSESYRLISDELSKVDSPYLTTIKYLDKELFVDSRSTTDTEFPVLLMDWVDGVNLDKYVRDHINDQYVLSMLAYRFSQLSMWLLPQPFAHGDLKQDNILVKEDGSLVLVDYDGMYVPAMEGQLARELGSPDFRHPLRTESTFNEHIDDFSVVSILLSLKAIAVKPSLLGKYGAPDRLLFSERDYRDSTKCNLMQELYTYVEPELNLLCSAFTIALNKLDITLVSPQILSISKPVRHHIEIKDRKEQESTIEHPSISEDGFENGHKYVDLGLSVLWASCNIGARTPEDVGGYCSWCRWENYGGFTFKDGRFVRYAPNQRDWFFYNKARFWNEDDYDFIKYNRMDKKSKLDIEDDAANRIWKGHWRIPSKSEWEELINKCEWVWVVNNGIGGYKVSSKIQGYTHQSIFLPLTGYCAIFEDNEHTFVRCDFRGYYWARTRDVSSFDSADSLLFYNKEYWLSHNPRFEGLAVRPVCILH